MPQAPGRPSRRAILKGTLLLGSAGLLPPLVSACSSQEQEPAAARATVPVSPTAPARPLVAYFSRAGENYHYGGRRDLVVGNTQVVAGMIAELAAADVFRIEPAQAYPQDYEATVERNRREQRAGERPALLRPPPNITAYGTVLLGCPVWSSGLPMIMRTFLDAVDLRGRTILPFVTYAVSGLSGIPQDYAELLPGSTVGDGLAVQGEEAGQARDSVEDWLRASGLR
jgi:flavodoxin